MEEIVEEVKTHLSKRKLRRMGVDGNHWLGGVCAGVAYWLGTFVWLVRLIWVVATLFYGIGVIPYILLWIFLPKWKKSPEDFARVTGD